MVFHYCSVGFVHILIYFCAYFCIFCTYFDIFLRIHWCMVEMVKQTRICPLPLARISKCTQLSTSSKIICKMSIFILQHAHQLTQMNHVRHQWHFCTRQGEWYILRTKPELTIVLRFQLTILWINNCLAVSRLQN